MQDLLPELIRFSNYGGNWDKYLDALYKCFLEQIVNANLSFDGVPVRCRFLPKTDGKGFGFWHLISESKNGGKEEDRVPDISRCERISWIPWIIKQFRRNNDIDWFENTRGSSNNIVLWYRPVNYVVILSKRNGYYLLLSAYTLTHHREKAFEEELKAYRVKG